MKKKVYLRVTFGKLGCLIDGDTNKNEQNEQTN